jgi:hypothetical protein
MALTPPKDAIYPQTRIKNVIVLHDGTKPPHNEFSIAKLILHNGDIVFGIRWDRNSWNAGSDENGYPSSRGYPTWFILPPNMKEVLSVLNGIDFDENSN